MSLSIPILHEDSSLVVVNKPPHIVVNRAQSVKAQTVQDWARERYFPGYCEDTAEPLSQHREDEPEYMKRNGIVHRLDKDTSGVLLIALTQEVFEGLQSQFQNRTVKKTYRALLHGRMAPQEGRVDVPVGRLPWNRERFGVVPEGKPSQTAYTVLSVYEKTIGTDRICISHVEFRPETGRTHQIRVHAQYLGHPLVADERYGGRKRSRADKAWAPRIMLHAYSISVVHPATGKKLSITAPLPEDFARTLAFLSS